MPDFPIWPQCNIGCVFCSNPVEGFRDTTEKYSYKELNKKPLEYKAGAKTFVKFDDVRDYFNLTGGEPTIHPEFHKVLGLIRTEFPKNLIRLLSNGRMFSYDDFARRACGIAGLPFEVCVPVFGYDAKTHESISRTAGSFDQTVAGLRNLQRHRRPGQLIEVRIILTRIQMRYFEGLLEFLLKEFPWIDRVTLLFEELEGFAEHYKNALVMPMSECAQELDRNYELLKRFKKVWLLHFALCTVPTRLWPWIGNSLAPFKIMYRDSCLSEGRYKEHCVGIHRSYDKYTGAPDIHPITEPRPVALSGDKYHPFQQAVEGVSSR